MSFEPWIILAGITLLILLFGLYVLFYKKKRLSQKDIQAVQGLWKEIEGLATQHPEQAILKADKLLDHALKKSGFHGTLGEKLKKARAIFRDNDAVWSAHKVRNRIAHEIDVKISPAQAQFCLKSFKRALYDLGIPL